MTHPSIHKTAIPCSCAATCGVVAVIDFDVWNDDPREVFIELYTSYRDRGFRGRLRAAWGVIRRRDPWFHSVCLYQDGVDQLREALRG